MLYEVTALILLEAESACDVADGLNDVFRRVGEGFVVDWAFAGGDDFATPLRGHDIATYREGDAFSDRRRHDRRAAAE